LVAERTDFHDQKVDARVFELARYLRGAGLIGLAHP